MRWTGLDGTRTRSAALWLGRGASDPVDFPVIGLLEDREARCSLDGIAGQGHSLRCQLTEAWQAQCQSRGQGKIAGSLAGFISCSIVGKRAFFLSLSHPTLQ